MADLASFQYQFNRQSPVPSSAVAEVDDFQTSGGFTRPDPVTETRQVDPAAENRRRNLKKADDGDEEAAFAIYKIPEYRRLLESAVRRGDRQAAVAVQTEMMTFANDHRDGLRKWTGLRNNGDWGTSVSEGVESVLDESYLDKWGQQVAGPGGRTVIVRSVGSFLQDTSPEARESDAKMYASRNAGMDLKLARMLTDPDAAGHSIFAGDKALLDDFAKNGDRSPGASESRLAREWVKTKYDMLTKYTADGSWDETDAGAFFSSWENRFGFSKNGGRDVLDSALAEYRRQSRMSATDFVNLYASRVEGLKEPPVNVTRRADDGSTRTYQVPQGPEESGKAMGIGNALLRKATEYGVGADVILRNGALWGSSADIRRELANYANTFGIKVYDTDAEINSHAAETAMYEAGIPGATDRLGFFRDAKASLESALVTTEKDRGVIATVGPDGKPQVSEITVSPAFTEPIEKPILKAAGRAMSSLRRGEQSWASLLADVASDPVKKDMVLGEMANAVLVTANAEVRNRIAEAAFNGMVSGRKVDFSEVLGSMWKVPDGDGGMVTAKADELRRDGLLLGQTTVNPVDGNPVSLSASNGYFTAMLRADPEKVMPRKDGEPTEVMEAFRKVGDALAGSDEDSVMKAGLTLVTELSGQSNSKWASYFRGGEWTWAMRSPKQWIRDQVGDNRESRLINAVSALVSGKEQLTPEEVLQLAAVYSAVPKSVFTPARGDVFTSFRRSYPELRARIEEALAANGFVIRDGDVDLGSGVKFMESRNPALRTKSPTRVLLFNTDGSARDSRNLGVSELLMQQQQERVNSASLARSSEPAEETPAMREARRLSETYGKDALGARGAKRLWDWCQREFSGDPSAAAQMFAVKSAQYQALRHRSEADAAAFVDEQDRYEMRYFPKLDNGGVIPGQVERSERPMTQEEFDEYVTKLNEDLVKRNQRPLTKAEWDRYNAEGRVVFRRAMDRGERLADRRQQLIDAAQVKDQYGQGGG